MENTLENKAKLFGVYYNQKVLKSKDYLMLCNSFNHVGVLHKAHLELKPLSSITDEDAMEVYNIVGDTMFVENSNNTKKLKRGIIRMLTEYTGSWLHVGNCSHAIDYLRSKGYALPFRGLSVEQLVEYGWIKLKTA